MRKSVLTVILFTCIVGFLWTQSGDDSSEDWYLDKPIEDITFVGLDNISITELEGIISPYIGKKFSNPLFWDLQSALYALDYFEELLPEAVVGSGGKSKVIIQFTIKERPVIDSIEIEGNRSIRRSTILDSIVLKIGDMVNNAKLSVDTESIRALYLEKGYPDVDAEGRIERVDDSTAKVVFVVNEGSQTKVKDLSFSGNSFASESTLRRIMKTKAQSLFSTGVFQESRLAEDISIIEGYYWDRGYIDARVVEVVRDIQENEDGDSELRLTFYIEEGVQYVYGGMSFEGNQLYSDERLTDLLRQVPGKVFSKTKLETDFLRINDIYSSDGYIYNGIRLEETRDEENRVISYTVNIVERGRAHIENIVISGNEKTQDYVIYRELPFEEGDIFSARKFVEGHQNLLNTQYFSSILPDVRPGSGEGLVDVIFNVEEGRTVNIEFGITFSGADTGIPIVGVIGWNDSNFLGRGQNFRIGTEISGNTQNLNFSFGESWLFGERWSASVDLTLDHSLAENIRQDILAPIYSEKDSIQVPDPYNGHYVWVSDDEATPEDESGSAFDGTPEELVAAIAAGDVQTDYAYALQQGETIDSSYLMGYDSYNITLGGSTGYTFVTPVGRVALATRLNTELSYVTYDSAIYRPFDSEIRDNLNRLQPITKLILNASFDSRDLIYSPTKGLYAKQAVTYAGGILPSTRDYISTSTKFQAFATLFDVPVAENWNLKGVLAFNTALSLIFPQWANGDDGWAWRDNTTSQDLLYIDGMTMARGWPRVYEGKALWDTWLELRMPIVEQYVWWDFFASGTGIWSGIEKNPSQTFSQFGAMGIDDFYFGFGGGARLTIPGFPIGLYFTKRFKIDQGIQWEGGNILAQEGNPDSGIDFVISFTADLF